jgi:uncharacterized protein DUF5995
MLWTVAAFAAALALLPATASAQDPGPAYDDWNPGWIGFPSNAKRSARGECRSGSSRCINRTIGEMYRRFNTVVPVCDGNAIFSITYIRVTEDIRQAVSDDFYPDVAWLERQDATFARTYFLAYDNYLAGRIDLVPPAWRIAFDAGRDDTVKGIGNLLLSMNAHINRDFPFILYHSGLVDSDGTSRKPQHDSYNPRLRALYKPIIDELTSRFDPSVDDYDIPGTADDDALFQILVEWRETAWQNAQRLANASTDAERRQVAQSIEDYAVSQAEAIYAGSTYLPGETTEARDAQCAAHGGQDPRYERGSDIAHFGSSHAKRNAVGKLSAVLRCPNGPGPCNGTASVEGQGRERPFSVPAGERKTLRLGLISGAGPRVRVKLHSLLGPGVDATRRRTLRVAGG